MLKEEIELQALIRDHDGDDPMKDYLIRQKKEEVELPFGRKGSKGLHDINMVARVSGTTSAAVIGVDLGKGLSDIDLDHPKNDSAGLGLLNNLALPLEKRRKTEGLELGTRARTGRGGGKEREVGIGDTEAVSIALDEIDVDMRINPGTMY